MTNFDRNCRYCKYYGLPVMRWTHNPGVGCISNTGFPHFELKEEIKVAIESEKSCDTCKLLDLPDNQYPCCDCDEDNDYKHFKELDDESKGGDIKVAIESEKNCDTCGLKDLDNNMYPCCDCQPSNNYEHWEEGWGNIKEAVDHPNHYQSSKFEVIDIIDEFGKDYKGESAFDFGNVVKYVIRAKKKNGLEDLRKARWYLDRLIDKWED